ncbi:MAG: hypothetical protein AAFZ17_09545 [Cyanobacteria bacterium J06650_10]
MMFRNRILRLSTAVACSLSALSFLSTSASAQRNEADLTEYLLDAADCITSGSSSASRLYDELSTTSINRQVYDRLFSVSSWHDGGNTTISCRANSEEFSIVDLQMGVSDNSAQYGRNMTVNVYQGGNLRHTYNDVQAGTMISVVLDLNDSQIPRNANSFAVEIFNCQGRNQCHLQFVEARLHPNGNVTYFSPDEVAPESIENPGSFSTPAERRPTAGQGSSSQTNSSRQDTSSTETTSSRQETSPSEPTSTRQDPNPVSGILTNVVERFIDELFK